MSTITGHYERYLPRLFETPTTPGSQAISQATFFGKAATLGDMEFFCLEAPLEIGNRVWVDDDEDGIQDACEPGLDGVIVQLYDAACALIGQDTTANGGQYYFNQNNVDTTGITVDGAGAATATTAFNGFVAGETYYVVFGQGQYAGAQFTLPTGLYGLTLTDEGTNDEIDSDARDGVACGGLASLPFIAVTPATQGCDEHNYDMGLTLAGASVGNLVWKDLDANGLYDAGEPGMAGVRLALEMWDANTSSYVPAIDLNNNVVANDTTDANGQYLFSRLPDSIYRVVILGDNWTAGVFSADSACAGFVGTTGTGADDQVNDDDNGDQDGVTNPAMIVSANIDLRQGQEPDSIFVGGGSGDGDTNPSSDLSVDFGFVGYNLGNMVWHDRDNSGDTTGDGASPGIAGVVVQLVDGTTLAPIDLDPETAGVQSNDTTDANGYYLFTGIPQGCYRVNLLTDNFDVAGDALFGFYPSTGPQEEDDADDDGDNNDNGLDPGDTGYAGAPATNGVISSQICLGGTPCRTHRRDA